MRRLYIGGVVNILGVSDWRCRHDSSASVVCDGVLVAAVEEERFTRKKHDGSLPLHAIEYCLHAAGLTMAEVDFLAFPSLPFRTGPDSGMAEVDTATLRQLHSTGVVPRRALVHKRVLEACLSSTKSRLLNRLMHPDVRAGLLALRDHFDELPPIRFFGHHAAHAAAAFFASGMERAAVATVDGRGSWFASAAWAADSSGVRRLAAEPFTNSLGFFYRDCTDVVGLGEFGEGKTMGLAAYGDSEVFAESLRRVLDTTVTDRWYSYRAEPGLKSTGVLRRTNESILGAPYPDFAAACQAQLQAAVGRVAEAACKLAGASTLCLGGGVMLNCSSNGALAASGRYDAISLFPASGDAGLSVGAALLCSAEQGRLDRGVLRSAYWGPEFSRQDCESALRGEPRVRYRLARDIATEAAQSLAAGKVAGWFQGRMEIGPRALGNRSILADSRSTEVRDRVNQLKGREPWRPLAPSVLAERAVEYFDLMCDSPFMLLATQVRPHRRAEVAGIVHVDGSARPQTVVRDRNRPFYDLIAAFERATGVPMILNTSFNAAGEPIVCTPADAIRTFLRTGIDVLYLGDFVVERGDQLTVI